MEINQLPTEDDFKKIFKERGNKSWRSQYIKRWAYHSIVLDMLKSEVDNIDTILEVGNEGFYWSKNSVSIIENESRRSNDSDIVMDIRQTDTESWERHLKNGKLDINCSWPFEDKQFDMFIALEVWEHLWNTNKKKVQENWGPIERKKKYGVENPNIQPNVFKEVMRVSKRAILSFPYMWGEHNLCGPDNCHYQIDRETIKKWTCGVEPIKIIDGDNVFNDGVRTVYMFEF
jgi:hypothetical protein